MILALKSYKSIDKLKTSSFYHDDMIYWQSIPEIMWHYFIVNEKIFTDNTIKKLKNDKSILEFNVDYDGLIPKTTEILPNNSNFNSQWALKNLGQYNGFPGVDTKATQAWMYEKGSFDIVVAVLDAGIDVDHECLLGHIFVDDSETVNEGFDNDSNGYKNDFMGWNFEKNTFKSYSPSHGTAVASVITTNGNGMSGVAYRARILPVNIMESMGAYDLIKTNFGFPCGERQPWEDVTINDYNVVPTARVAQGIIYSANKGAHIITLAYTHRNTAKVANCGTYPYSNYMPDVRDAIKYAGRQGCIVVTSAGDVSTEMQVSFQSPAEGYRTYFESGGGDGQGVSVTADMNCFPGSYSRYFNFLINVTAHDNWGYLYSEKVLTSSGMSSYGGWMRGCCYGKSTVNIAAPGKDILVAQPDNSYGVGGGTSLSAGYVAGAAALIWSKNPYLSNVDVVNVLMSSATKTSYWANKVSCAGMLNIKTALEII